jgi:hypothetical protein
MDSVGDEIVVIDEDSDSPEERRGVLEVSVT